MTRSEAETKIETGTGTRIERQIGTQAERQIGTQAERQIGTRIERQIGTQAERQIGTQAERQIGTQAERQIGTQAETEIRIGIGTQTEIQTETEMQTETDTQTERPWPAPAKLNLFLHILGRRPDGYHELQTCFQFVDLCDDIYIRVRADGAIRRLRGAAGVPADADLCVRAANALKAATGCQMGADIDVVKRIPMGAGLGGGSSDAATCLVALNRLWSLNLPVAQLAALGLALGADDPVFVMGRAAWAEGVGELLTPLFAPLAPREAHYVILRPPVFVSTAEIFRDPELTRNSPRITIHGFLASGGRNDCLDVVRRRYPPVARALEWLGQFGSARLTGTGACVFLGCDSSDLCAEIVRKLPPGFSAFTVRGLNDSPLVQRLLAG
jgi:4-diphosphocytidyl-2-C-methyl-D-erythritol kinase